mmetsp:Transcript_18676/g.20554  ORF Transcript_18676/g.20554 Transcript_18676/m.20554 type:complete len:99 (-) Transcript_18676:57-353(-)
MIWIWMVPHHQYIGHSFYSCRSEGGCDLVVFCGTLDHFSLPNFSPHQRHTFQLHLVEGPTTAGITWSPENWLQYHHHNNNNNNNNNNVNNDDEKRWHE